MLYYKTTIMRFQKTFLLCRVTFFAKIGSSGFMLQVIISYIEGPSRRFLLKYLLKGSKLGVAFIFRHLVDIMALWYKSNVFESSLNNLRLFFSMHSNSNRIIQSFILKEEQVLMQAYSFLAGAGQLKTFFKLL